MTIVETISKNINRSLKQIKNDKKGRERTLTKIVNNFYHFFTQMKKYFRKSYP